MNIVQVIQEDKAARTSDMDNYSLQTIGAKAALKEFLGARSDDMKAKNQMYSKINEEGFVMQSEIKSDPRGKVTLNTVNVLFLGAGIRTDLVNKSLMLPISVDEI